MRHYMGVSNEALRREDGAERVEARALRQAQGAWMLAAAGATAG